MSSDPQYFARLGRSHSYSSLQSIQSPDNLRKPLDDSSSSTQSPLISLLSPSSPRLTQSLPPSPSLPFKSTAVSASVSALLSLKCRLYESKYPSVDELVMVNITSLSEVGAFVSLVEYGDIPGIIQMVELSKRAIKSVNSLVRINRQEVAMVIRVDPERGFIDLSKRRVTVDDVIKCEERFERAKLVHAVLRSVAHACCLSLEHLYNTIGWPLYRKYGHAYDAFMYISSTEDRNVIELNILRDIDADQSVKFELIAQIRQRFRPTFIKIRAEFDIECYSYEGINAIIASLLAGERCGNATAGVRSVKIKLLTSPTYIMTTLASEKDLGISTLNRCLETIRSNIVSRGGNFMLRMSPRALTQHEEGCFDSALKRLVDEETHRQDLRHEEGLGDSSVTSASDSDSSSSEDS